MESMTKEEALFEYTLRLGDNALILGHRLSEWTSHGPILEEDIALSNIGLDMLGHAEAFLKYAAEVEEKRRTADDLAFKRPEREFLNTLLVEQPNGNFAQTIARQFFKDGFDIILFAQLSDSKDETLSAIAAKSLKEIKYHLRHSSQWVIRLGDGTEESHQRMQDGVEAMWPYTGEQFEMTEADEVLIQEGIAVDLKSIQPEWEKMVSDVLEEATLKKPEDVFMHSGSRKGVHTEKLGFLLAEMQYLPRAYPDAKW